jgi:hypothetical protein
VQGADGVYELGCGCETKITEAGVAVEWSWCGQCGGNRGPAGLYCCGECGFRSRSFERLERHVYAEHLGVRVG